MSTGGARNCKVAHFCPLTNRATMVYNYGQYGDSEEPRDRTGSPRASPFRPMCPRYFADTRRPDTKPNKRSNSPQRQKCNCNPVNAFRRFMARKQPNFWRFTPLFFLDYWRAKNSLGPSFPALFPS
jgi:hypothetical protein